VKLLRELTRLNEAHVRIITERRQIDVAATSKMTETTGFLRVSDHVLLNLFKQRALDMQMQKLCVRKTKRLAAGGLLCVAGIANTYAADSARDAEMNDGRRIANQICSACHVVADDQRFPPLLNTPTPSFKEIANRSDVNAKELQKFITTTHWDVQSTSMRMPSQMLSKEETAAVSRYILSLRKRL
jgi:mono/diheme cytochrome c family protein